MESPGTVRNSSRGGLLLLQKPALYEKFDRQGFFWNDTIAYKIKIAVCSRLGAEKFVKFIAYIEAAAGR